MQWDEYFLNIAEQVALKSKDPSTKTGCVIVDEQYRPVSFGYNGFIAGCNESKMSQERPLKYHLVLHAEMNAILFSRRDLRNCILYTLYAPCENCLKHILQVGIKKIVYKYPVVKSKQSGNCKTMTTDTSIEAITRILQSMPDVECKNINGNSYLKDLWGDCEIPDFK